MTDRYEPQLIGDPDDPASECAGMIVNHKGNWVRHSDYAKLEQAIKRIEEAANAPIKIVWDSGRTPPVVQGLDKLLKEVADAAKMVEDV